MNKRTINRIVDCCLAALLCALMAYSLIGEALHEVLGTAILAIFSLHNLLHFRWWKTLGKGRYSAYRILSAVLDCVLLLLMLLQPLSGIALSKHLFTFLPVTGFSMQAHGIHMLFAYWCYVLMCFHIGLHLPLPWNAFKQQLRHRTVLNCALMAAAAAAAVYGVTAFIARSFSDYMFMKVMFAFIDDTESLVRFFADHLAIMALFALLGCLTGGLLKGKIFRRKHQNGES